jgi:hypothetical protein
VRRPLISDEPAWEPVIKDLSPPRVVGTLTNKAFFWHSRYTTAPLAWNLRDPTGVLDEAPLGKGRLLVSRETAASPQGRKAVALTENLPPDGCVDTCRREYGVTCDTQEGKSVRTGGQTELKTE